MKPRRIWIPILIAIGTVPGRAQVFDTYDTGASCRALAEPQVHPKKLNLTVGAPRRLSEWSPCVSYSSSVGKSARNSRLTANCRLWRGDEIVGTRQISGVFGYRSDEGLGPFSPLCMCHVEPFAMIEEGDALECDLSFRQFLDLTPGTAIDVSIGLASSESAWCGW